MLIFLTLLYRVRRVKTSVQLQLHCVIVTSRVASTSAMMSTGVHKPRPAKPIHKQVRSIVRFSIVASRGVELYSALFEIPIALLFWDLINIDVSPLLLLFLQLVSNFN